jgi:hypothetical protein
MAINADRIDDCVLALLQLERHNGQRVWRSFDWDATDRLHQKGLISDPVGRAKSVILTNEGLERGGCFAIYLRQTSERREQNMQASCRFISR